MTQCFHCGKTSKRTTKLRLLRGKYNPTTKHRQAPNLQWFTLPSGKRVKLCAKCKKGATTGKIKIRAVV